jgi:hypothetical protein
MERQLSYKTVLFLLNASNYSKRLMRTCLHHYYSTAILSLKLIISILHFFWNPRRFIAGHNQEETISECVLISPIHFSTLVLTLRETMNEKMTRGDWEDQV